MRVENAVGDIGGGPSVRRSKTQILRIRNVLANYGILAALIVLCLAFGLLSTAFFRAENVFNILRQVAIVGIVTVGMALVIITGGIDLSVGSIIGVSGVLTAKLMIAGFSPILAVIVSLAGGIVMGYINGFFINEVSLPPFVATLATMTALRGVAYIITAGIPIFGFTSSFEVLGQGYLWVIPIPVLITTAVFVLGTILLNSTKYGRYIYGVGGNEEATRLSGINVKRIKYLVYAICGFLSALAGVVLLSRINSGQPIAGQGYELDIITAVILGGVSFSGGEGKMTGVVVGVLIMGVLANGMVLLNIDEYVQWVVKGIVLLGAVSVDKIAQRRRLTGR